MSVGQIAMQGYRFAAGIGYIAIPSDIDRDVYISMCYKNYRVSIATEDGGFVNQCPIDDWHLSRIEFPVNPKELGTPVVYVNESIHNHPIIVGTLKSIGEMGDMQEGQFKIKRRLGNSFVEISGSGKDGFLNLTVDSDKAANLHINVFNKNKDASLEVNVSGDINTVTTGGTNITTNKGLALKTIDPDNDKQSASVVQDNKSHTFTNEKFIINGSDNPLVLGKVFKDLFDNFIETVAAATVSTAIGQMPLLNAAQIAAFKEQTETILSKVGFIDK